MKTFLRKKWVNAAGSALGLFFALTTGLQPASATIVQNTFDDTFMNLSAPALANSESVFNFSATVNIPPGEYLIVKSIDLYIYRWDNYLTQTTDLRSRITNPEHQIACKSLPLTTIDNKVYSAAPTAGGNIAVCAAVDDAWRYRQSVGAPVAAPAFDGYGPGPASIRYNIIWNVPSRTEWPTGPYQIDFEVNKMDYTTSPQSLRTYTKTVSLWLVPEARAGVVYLMPYINGAGRFTQAVNASYGGASITVDNMTKAIVNREPMSEIIVRETAAPSDAPAESVFAGKSYWFTPEGAIFDPPATIGVAYDSARFPSGVGERSVAVACWNNTTGKWDILPSEVDSANSIATTRAANFGIFTALASTRLASIIADNISITPSSVDIRKEVTVSATVTNAGDISGAYPVTFKVDNEIVASKDVTVAGKTSQKVSFTASSNATGAHNIALNELTGTFTVNLPPPPKLASPPSAPKFTLTVTPTPTPITPTVAPIRAPVPVPTVTSPAIPSTPVPATCNWWPVASAVFIVSVVAVFVFLYRRQSDSQGQYGHWP